MGPASAADSVHNHEFVIWLDGFRSIVRAPEINRQQCFIIRNHLNLVKAVTGPLDAGNSAVFDLISGYRSDVADTHSTETLFQMVPAVGKLDRRSSLAYWLQGANEIGELKEYSLEQCEAIAEKIEMVKEEERGELALFALNTVNAIRGFPPSPDPKECFTRLAKFLNQTFRHDIDPTYEGDQEYFGKVHRGLVETANEPVQAKS
jgi:hypothetical protein